MIVINRNFIYKVTNLISDQYFAKQNPWIRVELSLYHLKEL